MPGQSISRPHDSEDVDKLSTLTNHVGSVLLMARGKIKPYTTNTVLQYIATVLLHILVDLYE